jgi:3-phenylpropionate/trans-cinnamate dioxygenase ferredoxin reductase component
VALDNVVIVGASLAGLRAAEELRNLGHTGRITMVGDEPHRPYDRPALSKQVLAGTKPPDSTTLVVGRGSVEDLELDWRLGESASGLDLAARSVLLAGGETLPYDGLVIATGASPKRLPGTDHLGNVHTLRSLDDCEAIRSTLTAGPRRVAVVGAGFIGAEVAATCRGLGIEVSLIEALPVPLERGLGPAMGSVVADLHRDHGVDVRLGVGVVLIEGGDHAERIRLTDGTVLDVDLVVIGIGVTPNTAWLERSGLTIDNGVLCDATCAAAPGVVAAGDVARWPNQRFGEVMRIEHWDNAIAMGTHAARTLVAGPAAADAYEPIPWFWSDQYDRKIQLAGLAGPDDAVQVISGSVEERRFVAFYGRAGRLVGVLGMSQPAQVIKWRHLVEEGVSWDAALAAAAAQQLPGDAG